MRENGPLGDGGRISKEDNILLLKSLDKVRDEEKDDGGLIEDLNLIQNEENPGGIYNLNELPADVGNAPSELNESMIARKPKKNKKDSDKPKKAKSQKKLPESVDDLNAMSEANRPIAGWNFAPMPLPERHQVGGGNKFLSRLAWYSGKTIGKVLGWLTNILWLPGFIKNMKKRYSNNRKNESGLQESKDREAIPGWSGARFEEGLKNRDELDIDFRRAPDVWSYPIPEEAEESKGVLRDPIFSIYVSQPVEDQDKQMDANNSTGHSGVGIEFSRYSAISGRWERFKLRYGFYTMGGLPGTAAKAVTAFHKATIPGQLMDERMSNYDVSRSYPVKNRQVNDVLKESRAYADKGYNNYTRNCTTFAKKMAKVAKVPGADALFKQDEIEFSHKANRQLFGASIITTYTKADMSDYMTKVTHGDDFNYQGFGNKRASRQDYERYKNSQSYFKARPDTADMPNALAENLRRDRRYETGGTIGKWVNRGKIIDDVKEKIQNYGNDILEDLQQITPEGRLDGDLPDELSGIIDMLKNMERPLAIVEAKLYTRDELRQLRTGITDMIKKLNLLLFKYYKNDSRLHYDVMATISFLNEGIDDIDSRYRQTFEFTNDYETGTGDLGSMRNDMQNKEQTIRLQNGLQSVDITPSELEGWMQIYKTPQEALAKLSRYNELCNKLRTDDEEKEREKLARINDLAKDFAKSHRYMLDKDEFSQQDMDYAFALNKKEKSTLTEIDGQLPSWTASSTYQSLFLESVFKGTKERAAAFIAKNNIDDSTNSDILKKWLDEDMAKSIDNKRKVMIKIITALSKSEEVFDRKKLLDMTLDMIRDRYIAHLFTVAPKKNYDENIIDTEEKADAGDKRERLIRYAYGELSAEGKLVNKLIGCVIMSLTEQQKLFGSWNEPQ